ncbi:hypothetical protein ACHAW6_008490 [Cyclotella cf. meneghiniana]
MDIFDEEDLLAIANDEDSTSSHAADESCASSTETRCAATDDAAEKPNADGGSSEKGQSVTASFNVGQNHAAEEDSDDDSDNDFLGSWLTDLKNCEQKYQQKILETYNEENNSTTKVKGESCQVDTDGNHDNDSDDEASASDEAQPSILLENIHQDTSAPDFNPTTSQVANDENCEYAGDNHVATAAAGDSAQSALKDDTNALDTIEIQLGPSVLRWISDYQYEKRSTNKRRKVAGSDEFDNDAIIGIQRHFKECDESGPFSSCFLMNLKKNDHYGTTMRPPAPQHTAIIETSNADVCHDAKSILSGAFAHPSKRYIGDALLCANQDGRNANAMIDCLARYDPVKKCYILELVDMTVSNLHLRSGDDYSEPNSNEGPAAMDTAGIASPKQPEPLIVDPRLRARRAEDQVRKLKRGKRKSAG